MSVAKFDSWAFADGSTPTTLVQFQRWELSVTSLNTGISLGPAGNFNLPPSPSTGTLLTSLGDFCPKYSNSTLVLRTSPITFSEGGNYSDDYRLYAYTEDDSKILGWQRSATPYWSFANGYNSAIMFLHFSFPSWGNIGKRINIGMDDSGYNGAVFLVNGRYYSTYTPAPFYATIMEFAS